MNRKTRKAAIDILEYLKRNPQAKHSAEGIAKYWILQQRLEESIETVMAVIDYLLERGILEKIQIQNEQCFYRLNDKRIDLIQNELSKLKK